MPTAFFSLGGSPWHVTFSLHPCPLRRSCFFIMLDEEDPCSPMLRKPCHTSLPSYERGSLYRLNLHRDAGPFLHCLMPLRKLIPSSRCPCLQGYNSTLEYAFILEVLISSNPCFSRGSNSPLELPSPLRSFLPPQCAFDFEVLFS